MTINMSLCQFYLGPLHYINIKPQFSADSQWIWEWTQQEQDQDQILLWFPEALLTDVREMLTYTAVLSFKYAFYQCKLSYIHIYFRILLINQVSKIVTYPTSMHHYWMCHLCSRFRQYFKWSQSKSFCKPKELQQNKLVI